MNRWKGLSFFLFFLSFIWFSVGISAIYYIIMAGGDMMATVISVVILGPALVAAYGGYRSLKKSRVAPLRRPIIRQPPTKIPTSMPASHPYPVRQQTVSTTTLKEIGVLFDINKLESAFYGLKAWKIFLKNCNPNKLSSCTLLHGDTRETLDGKAQHFCIAVQAVDPETIRYVKEAFTNSQDKELLPLNQRFIEDHVTTVTGGYQPLPLWGRVDANGRFVTEKYMAYYEEACENAGWTYHPLSLSQAVRDSFIFGKDQKIWAAKKVAQYGDLQALSVLKEYLEKEKDEDVKRACQESIDTVEKIKESTREPAITPKPSVTQQAEIRTAGTVSKEVMGIPPKSKTDVCAKCGRTRERIEWEFEQMRKSGVFVIGGDNVLLYCDNCKRWFCGSCQVDLGMNSGCPICRKALD